MKMRRVVTGHTQDGKAIVASDTEVEGITITAEPGLEFHVLWGADHVPTLPDDGSPPSRRSYFPPPGGFRLVSFTLPPLEATSGPHQEKADAVTEFEQKLPGLISHMELDNPGMHTTDSIDFDYIISGETWLELDDGKEVYLQAGDTVIQNGTRHAWRNRGGQPCRILTLLIGANRLNRENK